MPCEDCLLLTHSKREVTNLKEDICRLSADLQKKDYLLSSYIVMAVIQGRKIHHLVYHAVGFNTSSAILLLDPQPLWNLVGGGHLGWKEQGGTGRFSPTTPPDKSLCNAARWSPGPPRWCWQKLAWIQTVSPLERLLILLTVLRCLLLIDPAVVVWGLISSAATVPVAITTQRIK